MWFPWSKKQLREGPEYAGYNERAIATTLDLVVFLFFMLRPIYWAQEKVQAHYLPQVDTSVLEGFQQEVQGQGWMMQLKYAAMALAESGAWKMPVITNGLSTFMVLSVYVACLLIFRTTPGKWLMGVKITKTDGETFPAAWQIILRSFAAVISCIPFMMGFLWMSFDKHSRAWHDMIAGTRVITTRPDGWYWEHIKKGLRWLRAQIFGAPDAEEPPTTPPKAD